MTRAISSMKRVGFAADLHPRGHVGSKNLQRILEELSKRAGEKVADPYWTDAMLHFFLPVFFYMVEMDRSEVVPTQLVRIRKQRARGVSLDGTSTPLVIQHRGNL